MRLEGGRCDNDFCFVWDNDGNSTCLRLGYNGLFDLTRDSLGAMVPLQWVLYKDKYTLRTDNELLSLFNQ